MSKTFREDRGARPPRLCPRIRHVLYATSLQTLIRVLIRDFEHPPPRIYHLGCRCKPRGSWRVGLGRVPFGRGWAFRGTLQHSILGVLAQRRGQAPEARRRETPIVGYVVDVAANCPEETQYR